METEIATVSLTSPSRASSQYLKCAITFGDQPTSPEGITFGSSRACNITHPDLDEQHFSIDFNDADRLVLRNLSQTRTTEVFYQFNHESVGGAVLIGRPWMISGASFPEAAKSIRIQANETVFLVQVKHDVAHQQNYKDLVTEFHRKRNEKRDQRRRLLSQSAGIDPRDPHAANDHRHISRFLGQGGQADVYHYWNPCDGNEFARKIFLRGPQASEQCENEAKMMAGKPHHHVLKLLESSPPSAGERGQQSSAYLDLEYIHGMSLRHHITQRKKDAPSQPPYTPCVLLSILLQSLDAISHLHNVWGVTHRDFKLDNILVNEFDPNEDHMCIKVADFGFSKHTESLKTANIGTKPYMAPEQTDNFVIDGTESKFTPAMDIWAVGVMMLELLGYYAPIQRKPRAFEYWQDLVMRCLKEALDDTDDALLVFISKHMLRVEAKSRLSATACREEALKLPGAARVAGFRCKHGIDNPGEEARSHAAGYQSSNNLTRIPATSGSSKLCSASLPQASDLAKDLSSQPNRHVSPHLYSPISAARPLELRSAVYTATSPHQAPIDTPTVSSRNTGYSAANKRPLSTSPTSPDRCNVDRQKRSKSHHPRHDHGQKYHEHMPQLPHLQAPSMLPMRTQSVGPSAHSVPSPSSPQQLLTPNTSVASQQTAFKVSPPPSVVRQEILQSPTLERPALPSTFATSSARVLTSGSRYSPAPMQGLGSYPNATNEAASRASSLSPVRNIGSTPRPGTSRSETRFGEVDKRVLTDGAPVTPRARETTREVQSERIPLRSPWLETRKPPKDSKE